MIFLLAALALQPQLVAPPPNYVPTEPPMPEALATDPATGMRLIRETCWDHLRDPVRLQAAAERAGFNFFWFGSRRESRAGTGAGTLNFHDAGVLNPRGSDRQCDIYLRIEPRDHNALVAALASALGLPAAEPPLAPPTPGWVPPTRETRWIVVNADGSTSRIELVSSHARRGGNVHFYVTLYPKTAATRPRRRG
ncbi:MAG TPA: hypothetical protein VF535_12455 [Allosphingosinicella sp.]|jgi:hypothetical protein